LALNREYSFSDENVAVFTWYGCRLQTYSEHVSAYISDSTPMVAIVNTHMQLEAMRDAALANQARGPRVLIAGPPDSGKSTTARILAAYACRLDRTPLFLDLDVGQNAITLPGALCATPLNKFSLSVEEGFLHTTPLVYSLGHNTPRDHGEVYNKMTSILAQKVDERLKRDLDLCSSGIIVNTSGHIDDDGYEALLHSIKELHIDVVLVMGHDRLYSNLSSSLQNTLAIVKLPQSGGVVRREKQQRTRARQACIQEYFYGKSALRGRVRNGEVSFSPARLDLQISSLVVMKAGGLQLSEHMRVMGDQGTGSTELVRVHPTEQELDRSILAVLFADERETAADAAAADTGTGGGGSDEVGQSLLRSNVAGFVYVVSVDIEQDTMTVLAPNAGPLPSDYLLLGSIKWDEK